MGKEENEIDRIFYNLMLDEASDYPVKIAKQAVKDLIQSSNRKAELKGRIDELRRFPYCKNNATHGRYVSKRSKELQAQSKEKQ